MKRNCIEYLKSDHGEVHVINASLDGATMEAGVLCVFSYAESTIRISNEQDSFLVELSDDLRARGEKLKAFNVLLTVLDHESL